jgi:UDP-N-acetylglucosamine 2-epimerase (non-hydrolysing)
MKIAPIVRELDKRGLPYRLIHTGQHYDYNMSKIFFEQLSLPEPDYYLGVGSGTHTFQTAKAMLGLEKAFGEIQPDIVVVVGDVNSTLAGALAAVKSGIPAAHVEAGLRSFDRTMPEEINRLLTDAICDLLFTTCEDANKNLLKEGVPEEKIHFVGNTMIDTLVGLMGEIEKSTIVRDLGLQEERYVYVTLHRPSNVDDPMQLAAIAEALSKINDKGLQMVLPLHPRTKQRMGEFNLADRFMSIHGLMMTDPVSYNDSIALARSSMAVLTDSGGLQEETTFLGVPCLTLRPNTERPVTINEGTNTLLDKGAVMVPTEIEKILRGETKRGRIPALWDGKAASRIVAVIEDCL